MKTLLVAIGVMLVTSGLVSVNLWRDLRTERLENTQLRMRVTEVSTRPRVLPASAQSVAVPAPAPVVSAAPVAAAGSAPLPTDKEVAMTATMAAINAGAAVAAKGFSEADLMKDPEFRKARLIQARLQLAHSNPGLAETLGLSQKEANHLFEVMAESQVARSTELTEALTREGGVGGAVTEILRTRAGSEDPARAVLGEARFAQYQEYQRNVRPALTQVANIGSSLNAAGTPLSDSQNRALTGAMMTEQQRQRQEAAMPPPMPNPGAPRSLMDSLEATANRQAESDRRILEASEAILNAAQLDVLKQQFEQQDATRRRSIETAKDLDAGRSTPPQPAGQPARVP